MGMRYVKRCLFYEEINTVDGGEMKSFVLSDVVYLLLLFAVVDILYNIFH